jgi:ribosomal protein S18 acetylase RimI-like enzyme
VIDLRPADELGAQTLAPLLARWAYEAGSPLDDWRFGGRNEALEALRAWVLRPSSEVALARWQVAFLEEAPQGGFVAMSEPDLIAARRSDLLALVTSADAVTDLRERLAGIHELFSPLDPGDFYLSRIAVEPSARGQGLGARLLSAVVATAAQTGATAVRADVSADNDAAIALYRKAGFEVGSARGSEPAGLSYRPVRLEV